MLSTVSGIISAKKGENDLRFNSVNLLNCAREISPLFNNASAIAEDKIELERLFARLNELMPEAVKIGELRQKGLSDEKIADAIGIKRTTFLSRIKKIKELLKSEYPDLF